MWINVVLYDICDYGWIIQYMLVGWKDLIFVTMLLGEVDMIEKMLEVEDLV